MKSVLKGISKLLNDEPPASLQCRVCLESKPLEDFQKHNKSKWGRSKLCRPCFKKNYNDKRGPAYDPVRAAKQRAKMTPEQREAQSQYLRARKYGMTREEMLAFVASQPTCRICNEPSTDIDHCHTTMKVRGMLCKRCNLTLGYMQDNPERLRAAASYLENHS